MRPGSFKRLDLGARDIYRLLLRGRSLRPVDRVEVNSMLADIADENELETGVRREGVIYAFRAFTNKVTSSIGILIGGFLLK